MNFALVSLDTYPENNEYKYSMVEPSLYYTCLHHKENTESLLIALLRSSTCQRCIPISHLPYSSSLLHIHLCTSKGVLLHSSSHHYTQCKMTVQWPCYTCLHHKENTESLLIALLRSSTCQRCIPISHLPHSSSQLHIHLCTSKGVLLHSSSRQHKRYMYLMVEPSLH